LEERRKDKGHKRERGPGKPANVFFPKPQRGMPRLTGYVGGLEAKLHNEGVTYLEIKYDKPFPVDRFSLAQAQMLEEDADKPPSIAFVLHDPITWAAHSLSPPT